MDTHNDFISFQRNRAVFENGGPVTLMFHKVGPLPWNSRFPALYVSGSHFDRQVSDLLAAGLPCLSLDETLAAARADQPGFCLTFDDGFRNVFECALPVLRARRVRAIQFIVAGLIGREDEWDRPVEPPRRPLMDDAQIREWLAAGQEIGAHTMTHPRLSRLPRDQARAEIVDSKRALEDRFGIPVRHFCYPYGNYDQAVRDLVEEAGFETACTITPGPNAKEADPFQLRRVLSCGPLLSPMRIVNRVVRMCVAPRT